jgi:hypothetical protein
MADNTTKTQVWRIFSSPYWEFIGNELFALAIVRTNMPRGGLGLVGRWD